MPAEAINTVMHKMLVGMARELQLPAPEFVDEDFPDHDTALQLVGFFMTAPVLAVFGCIVVVVGSGIQARERFPTQGKETTPAKKGVQTVDSFV